MDVQLLARSGAQEGPSERMTANKTEVFQCILGRCGAGLDLLIKAMALFAGLEAASSSKRLGTHHCQPQL